MAAAMTTITTYTNITYTFVIASKKHCRPSFVIRENSEGKKTNTHTHTQRDSFPGTPVNVMPHCTIDSNGSVLRGSCAMGMVFK